MNAKDELQNFVKANGERLRAVRHVLQTAAAEQQSFVKANEERLRAIRYVLLVVAVLAILWLLFFWLVLAKRETTDNAYVSGHQVEITAQVPGTVVSIYADDTQQVHAGQLLVDLDAADARVALARARATLAQAVRQARQMRGTADQYEAQVAGRKLEMAEAQADLDRREPLLKSRALSPEQVQHARDRVAVARSALLAARRQAEASRVLVGDNELVDQPAVQIARAAFTEAWLGLERTRIVSPVSGDVAQRTVQLGNRVQSGMSLMRVIPLDSLWVDANFKEVELRNLRIGQPAEVEVDLYGGGVVFHGKVAGFSPGTGAAFALLPPQNAAGNWVKIVQRVPVRIALDAREMAKYPLRIGLSAHVRVSTRDRSGARLSPPATAASGNAAAPFLDQASDQSGGSDESTAEADRIIAENAGLIPPPSPIQTLAPP